MKITRVLLFTLVLTLIAQVVFGNVLIVSESPLKGKITLPQEDVDFVNTMVTYSLNDLADVLPYSYIGSYTAQEWYNSIVDIINSTNTNVVIIKGKPSVPKPLPKIQIKSLDSKTISTITKLIPDIKGAISSSYSISKDSVNINIQLTDQTGKVINKKSFTIPLSSLKDRDSVILQVKENLVDLLSAWKYYYYDPKRTAIVNISFKPSVKTVSILVKPDNIQLKPGKNTLNEGDYTLLITSSGYQPIITNIFVPAGGNINLTFSLQKATPIESPVPMGTVYIDANVKDVPLIIAEGNIFGKTPLYTNLTEGTKNIIFQQTATTLLKSIKIDVKPNDINYYYINLERIGAGVNIVAENGSFVVINRKLEGVITTGSYSKSLTKGIHTITVFKNGFEPFRTNINITSDEKVTINVKFEPKKVPIFVITPQTKEAIISLNNKPIGNTPYTIRLEQGKESKIDILSQEVGFNNESISYVPMMNKINSVIKNLSPLYGDLLVLTDPTDAIVRIDGRIVGKTGLDGLLLKSISARKSFVFVQKEGYKAVKTNIYILPNVQNSLSFKLKEAPIKLFINTLPVQNVSIYFNDEYYGENDGVINVELGNFVMKLVKRGFKTIYTNVSFPDKIDTVIPLTFQMVPGLSEVEIVEYANSNLVEFNKLFSNENYLEAYNILKTTKEEIIKSGYTNYSVEISKVYEFVSKKENEIKPKVEFSILNNEANDVIVKVDSLSKVNAFDDSIKVLKDFITKVNSSSLSDEDKNQILGKVKDKYKEVALISINSKVSNILIQAEKFIAKGEKSAAASIYEDAIKEIDELKIEFPEIEGDISKLRDSIMSNYIPIGIEAISNKVQIVLIQAEDLEKKKNYTNAIDLISSAIKEIKLSKLYFLDEVKSFEAQLNERYEYLVNKSLEEEQMGEVKGVYDEIKPILKEAIRLASIEEYDSAIKKYQEALKIIEISEFKENPFLIKLKDSIIADIAKIEQEKKQKEELKSKKLKLQEEIEKKKKELPWWVRMQKAWTGVGFEFFGSTIIPQGSDFYITNMNIPTGAKIHISFLPIMGINVGGFYNVNSYTVSSNSAYLMWMGLGQIELRIPIIKQFSIIGAFGSGISQSILEPLKFRMGQDFILNTGIDLKFSWFGMRLTYDMMFYDNFAKNQFGGSFGIILWATED